MSEFRRSLRKLSKSLRKPSKVFRRGQSRKRKALTEASFGYVWWRYLNNGGRTLNAWRSQPYFADTYSIAHELIDRGIVVGQSDRYLSEEGLAALADASDLVLDISRQSHVQEKVAGGSGGKKDYLAQLIPWDQEHATDSALLRVALDKKLLEIVSIYLGMWPQLHAIGAWLNFPCSDPPKQSQLWHRDPEDIKIIKAFIYLVDVDEECGPFCYIPETHPFGSRAGIVAKSADQKRTTDNEMSAAVLPETWMTCTGPAGTMILADTVGYHRGGKPTVGNRILITFTYTSGTPHDKRVLRISGKPSWITSAIQRAAL